MTNEEMKRQLELAFAAPEPTRREVFLRKFQPKEISATGVLLQQLPYIQKGVWIMAVAILTVAIGGAYALNPNTERITEALVPFAAAATSVELQRSHRYRMSEFEMATRFSAKTVFWAKMLSIGLLYAAVFCIVGPVLSIRFTLEPSLLSFRILAPYLLTASFCLHLERTAWGRKTAYLSTVVASLTSLGVLWIGKYDMEAGTIVVTKWSLALLLPLFLLTGYESYKTIKTTEAFA